MDYLDVVRLKAHHKWSYRLASKRKVTTPAQAEDFINERAFIFLWPITGIDLPSLWVAVAGDRPVADKHNDPGHVTWGWKDAALNKRRWYYAKILRRKATFISLQIVPFFYALTANYGSPEEDHRIAYEEGRLTLAAKNVYDALLEKGPLNTLDLRKEARLQNAKESTFARALEDLQTDLKILPIGVADAGGWRYSYIYEITSRHFPNLPEQARSIDESSARHELLDLYFKSVGASQIRNIVKLFGWSKEIVYRTLGRMINENDLIQVNHPNQPGDWFALPNLIQNIPSTPRESS